MTDLVIHKCLSCPDTVQIPFDHECDIQKIFLMLSKLPSKDFNFNVGKYFINKIREYPSITFPREVMGVILYATLINYNFKQKELSLDEIKLVMESSNFLKSDIEEFFMGSCHLPTSDIIMYFINECGCDIDIHDSSALYIATKK